MRSSVWIASRPKFRTRAALARHADGLVFVALLLLTGCAGSVPPKLIGLDQPIALEPGEGALVVELDAREPVLRVLIEPVGRFASSVTLENLPAGRHAHLLVLPAGRYRWREFDMKGTVVVNGRPYPKTWRMEPDDEHWQFDVRPGAVNYPGLVFLERLHQSILRTYTMNRSAQLVQTIGARRRALLIEYPFVYTGRGRDDFLEIHSSRLASSSESKKVDLESPADPQ